MQRMHLVYEKLMHLEYRGIPYKDILPILSSNGHNGYNRIGRSIYSSILDRMHYTPSTISCRIAQDSHKEEKNNEN